MRWPFQQKPSKPKLPPEAEQRWAIAEGAYGDGPILIRHNQSAKEFVGSSDLPIKLGFAIPLKSPRNDGFPDDVESEQLHRAEDAIVAEVGENTVGLHVMTVTAAGVREYVFYIARGADVAALHSRLQQDISTHDVQCIATEEPDWESYRSLVP